MTPSPEMSAPAGGGYDLDARLDRSFSAAEPEVTDQAEQQDAPELPAEPELEAAPEEPTEPVVDDEEDPSEQVTDDSNRTYYRVKPSRMQNFTAAAKFQRELSDIAPTIEDARAHYQAASDFRAIQSDFASTEPEGIQKFMDYWSQGAPEGFQAMASELPKYLDKLADSGDAHATGAIGAICSHVYQRTTENLYARAQRSGDPKDLYKAQSFDFALHGKYHDSLDKIPQRAQPQPVDQLAQREQAFNQRVAQDANQRWAQFDASTISGAKDSALTSAVDAAFKVAESAFTPGLLSAAKREAIAQVTKELEKQFEWNRNQTVEQKDIQRDFLKAIRSGEKTNLEPRAAALVSDFKARIARVLPGIVKPLIGERAQTVMQQSQANHQRLATGAKKIAPGAGGKPAPRSIAPMQPRQSVGDRMDQIFG